MAIQTHSGFFHSVAGQMLMLVIVAAILIGFTAKFSF